MHRSFARKERLAQDDKGVGARVRYFGLRFTSRVRVTKVHCLSGAGNPIIS
jgi:hypothetical protein